MTGYAGKQSIRLVTLTSNLLTSKILPEGGRKRETLTVTEFH